MLARTCSSVAIGSFSRFFGIDEICGAKITSDSPAYNQFITNSSVKNMPLPDNVNEQKLTEMALALLWLGCHDDQEFPRAWKSFDWDLMNLLHEKGYISNPVGKAKSVYMSPEAAAKAAALFEQHFGSAT